tara:strand:+ start:2211 stop:2327 length:117 start_codon:yes stop_codon:yes gene_type:complete
MKHDIKIENMKVFHHFRREIIGIKSQVINTKNLFNEKK